MGDFIFMFRVKRTIYLSHFRLDEAVETGLSDKRGERRTAEFHPSEVKLNMGEVK